MKRDPLLSRKGVSSAYTPDPTARSSPTLANGLLLHDLHDLQRIDGGQMGMGTVLQITCQEIKKDIDIQTG